MLLVFQKAKSPLQIAKTELACTTGKGLEKLIGWLVGEILTDKQQKPFYFIIQLNIVGFKNVQEKYDFLDVLYCEVLQKNISFFLL